MAFNREWLSKRHNITRVTPLRIATFYALISGAWILFSDHLLGAIVKDHSLFVELSTAKGWVYVAVMAGLLYLMSQRGYNFLLQSETALQQDREHLERYRLLAKDALDLIIFISPEGQIIDANEAAVKRYGYTREELTHMPVHNLRLPVDQLTVPYFLEKAPQGLEFELQHVCKDGSVFPIDISAKGATSNGKPIIVSVIRDITKRKETEATIWLEKERAQVTLQSIGDAVITTDVRANVEYLNAVAEYLTGWTNLEAIGQPVETVLHIIDEETGQRVESPIIRCLDEGNIVSLANHTLLINKKGLSIAIEESAAPIRDRTEAVIGGVLVFRDVSYKRNLMKELAHQAQHDALTGLPNRLHFTGCLNLALARAKHQQGMLAVMFLDLDRFKLINDTMGHNLGDLMLKDVAARLSQTLREGDAIARLGGDEFLILLAEISDEQEAIAVSKRILGVFTHPILLKGHEIYMSTSIGISLYPNDGNEMETLVKHADTAMYYAKEQGRNNYQFFTEDLNLKANQRLSTENSLRKALIREEFILHYQPQVNIQSGHIVGVEALIRWDSAEQGIISPLSFIPVAEETGLIIPIGEWVLRTACSQSKAWQEQGYPNLSMAVNISARQFREPKFLMLVEEVLRETGLDPRLLELEITESIAMENGDASVEMLRSLKNLGIRIAIDDFGTGFSSLNYLRRMPIDTLKIDQSFIKDIGTGENGEEVVAAIINLAKNLHLTVIAEGVETNSQRIFLKDKRCNQMQGFLFSKAVPSQELEQLFDQYSG